jgi:excisionase family DNA binding protein
MVRRGSSVRVRHWALSFCRHFLRGSTAPPRPEVQNGYVRPPAGPSSPTAGAPAAQSPKAARRADPERSERVDGAAGRRHTAPQFFGGEGATAAGSVPSPAMADQQRVLLTVRDVAEVTGLSDRAIYHAVARGELRAIRVCSRIRIPQEWFDEWLDRAVVEPEPAFVMPPEPVRPGSFKALLRVKGGER